MVKLLLTGVVAAAFLGRAALIWLTRPEYVGWFNHSYYYWVQTRGLLLDGALPYTDLPLLFYAYAAIAGLLQSFGVELEPAIINAARLCMSLAPALIAVPVFLTLRRIFAGDPLTMPGWLLVGVSAFLPLTIAHMPELLQKNMLGLLLLFCLNYRVLAALHDRSRKNLTIIAGILLIIALTHLGTLAVAVAFSAVLAVAIGYETRDRQRTLLLFGAFFGLLVASTAIVARFDPDACLRVWRYSLSSLSNSLLGELASGRALAESLLLLAGVIVPAALAFGLLRVFARNGNTLALPDRIFWLSQILLAYLLVAPVIDLDVMPRLILFLPLPAIFILAYHLRYCPAKWVNRLTMAVATAGTVIMLIGDATGVLLKYPDKAETRAELDDMRHRLELGSDDFILTPYGGNTICNWFLGTRAGLITAFNRNDTQNYARIFILNPPDAQVPGEAVLRMRDGRITFATEQQKYEAMRLNIPVTGLTPGIGDFQHLELYKLDEIPDDWVFDDEGNWIGADYSAYLEQ